MMRNADLRTTRVTCTLERLGTRLSPEIVTRLHLRPVSFELNHEIERPGNPIRHLFFVEEGMASMTATFEDGSQVEVGMFGYESVIGISALTGTKQSLNGVYTQIAGLSTNFGSTLNGFKLRELFARPNAHDHIFFYAANFELSFNRHYWEDRTVTSEIRPIIGLHLKPWDIIYNPILDTDYKGGFGNLKYNPAGRVGYNLNDRWAVAAEEYDGFGRLHSFSLLSKQFHEVWATTDYSGTKFLGLSVETGVGYGLTAASDKWTLKLMLSRNLNTHPGRPWSKNTDSTAVDPTTPSSRSNNR